MIRKTSMLAIVAGTAVALCASIAGADEVKVIKAPGALDSVKVVKDKQTGKLRAATPEEAEEMANMPAQRLAPNVVVLSRPVTTTVSRADGSMTVKRSLDDLDAIVATKRADGKLSVTHKGSQASDNNLPKE